MYIIDNSTQANRVRHKAYGSLMDLLKLGDMAVCKVTKEIRINNCGKVVVFEVGDTVVIGEYSCEINKVSLKIEEYNEYINSSTLGLQGCDYSGTYREAEKLISSLSIDEEETIKLDNILYNLRLDADNANGMKHEADISNPDVTIYETALIVASGIQLITVIALTVFCPIGWLLKVMLWVISVRTICVEWELVYKLDSNRKKIAELIQKNINNKHRISIWNIKRNGALPTSYSIDFKKMYNTSYLKSRKIVKELTSGNDEILFLAEDNSQTGTSRALVINNEDSFSESLN